MRFHLENGRAMHVGKTWLVTAAVSWTCACGVIRPREQPLGFPSAYKLAWCRREGRRLCRVCGNGEIHSSPFWEPPFQKDRLKLGKGANVMRK